MKIPYGHPIAAFCLALAMTCASSLAAQGVAPSAAGEALVYRPPLRGAPVKRVGGATRSLSEARSPITLIAPGDVGLTMSEQPALHWHMAQPAAGRMVFSLIALDTMTTVQHRTLPDSACTGFYRVSLAGAGVKLEPQADYRWQVAIVPSDPKERYGITSGVIRFTSTGAPDALLAQSPAERRQALAQSGVWYDLVTGLIEEMKGPQAPPNVSATFGNLLAQAGIDDSLSQSAICF